VPANSTEDPEIFPCTVRWRVRRRSLDLLSLWADATEAKSAEEKVARDRPKVW